MRIWQIIVTSSSEVLLLINVILSFIYLWRQSSMLRYFSGLLTFSLLIQILAHIIWFQHQFTKQANNLYLLHFYTVVEFVLISLFYHQLFQVNWFWKKLALWFIGFITLLIIANSIFLQPITVFNSNAKTLTQSIFIAYAITFFLQDTHNKENLYFSSLKTINSAILLYYAGSLFIFMFGNVFFQLDEFHKIFWVANALLYLIFQLLVFTAIWQFRQTKSTYS